DLKERDLDWTILRPGALTDEPGTGLVLLADKTGYGAVPRDDVAAILAELLDAPASSRRTLELISGETAVGEAIAGL
ncbi:MAG TPA: NAD(P)H-binding protein, partial [Amycolatopsis sp.]|nr:NAD(P)H-binding protein [Amycolatopsis sp.]